MIYDYVKAPLANEECNCGLFTQGDVLVFCW